MKIGAIIQARTSSTRLPGKVVKDLPYGSNITVLQQVIRRLKKSKRLNSIIVSTTTEKEDNCIIKLAKIENIKWFRGSRDDVLERYYMTAKENYVDIIVRITSDCPCIDPKIVDFVIEEHIRTCADFTSNALIKTYPEGLGVEVLNFSTLEKAHREAKSDFEREHVCPYIYKTNREVFKIHSLKSPKYLSAPEIRITLDTEEDYALLCAVFDYLFFKNKYFDTLDIIKLFKKKPWLKLINKNIFQKQIFDTQQEEVKEAIKILKFQDLKRAKKVLEAYI